MKKNRFICTVLFSLSFALFSQEALKSIEEEYYDFLSLQGITERPYLNYRTLSDSEWNIKEEENSSHPWKDLNLGTKKTLKKELFNQTNWFLKGINNSVNLKIYGPEWFNSFNTTAPYGQNDGALWQGKGYNTSLTLGARFEALGFEITLKPQVCFSQNLEFELMPSHYDSSYGYIWGYNKNIGIDAPQRFGNKPFWTFDWGDTEIRWTLHNFTIGFGTQIPWIGSAWINSLLGSNNAASYPKFDIGLRKTKIIIPGLNWNIGEIEARIWLGYLSESDYFDNNPDNNHNQISAFIFSYTPSFIPGFSIGATKLCLSKWGNDFWKYINPFYSSNDITGIGEDQKMAIHLNWISTKIGLQLYGEFGIDDYLQNGFIYGSIRYPFDSMVWTAGLKKTFSISKSKSVYGEFISEISVMDLPRNKGKQCYYAFNFHHQITQGFTNEGQYLGTMYGNGGNSQIMMLNIYYPKGKSSFLLGRNNPDNTYSYNTLNNHNETYKANFLISLDSLYYITKNFSIQSGITYNFIINSKYWTKTDDDKIICTDSLNNFHFLLNFKYFL